MNRPLRRDDRGVSNVIGAILVTGLLVISLVTIRTSYVPVWEERAARAEMQRIATQFSQVKSDLDHHVVNTTRVSLSSPLLLGEEATGMFAPSRPPNTVRIEGTGSPVRLHSNKLRLIQDNGSSVASVDEDFQGISGSSTIEDVGKVRHLRVRLDCVGDCRDAGDSLTISVTDADGNFAGDWQVRQVTDPPDNLLFVRTRDRNNDVLVDQPDAFFGTKSISPYWVWVNDPTYRFDQVLAAAKKPMDMTITENGLTGEFTVTYAEQDAEGNQVIVGGGGPTVEPFKRTLQGGAISYLARNSHYVNQDLILENGAVVVQQGNRAVIRVPAHATAETVGDRTRLTLFLPSVAGPGASAGGQGSVAVTTDTRERTSLIAEAPRFSYNVTTRFPDLWVSQWRDLLEGAGLSEGAGQFSLATGPNWANMTVFGTTADPASTEFDLTVTFKQATVTARIEQ